MPNTEHLETAEQPVSPLEGEETQSTLELAGEWDDNKRREAVKQNQHESNNKPLSYKDSLSYFRKYEKDFTDAGLESAKGNEERETWQTLAEKMRLDVELAKVGSGPPLGRLIREVESHLESLNRMKEEGGDEAFVHEGDIEDLRRVRDSLFTKYEQIPPSEMRESAESILVGLTGQPVPEYLRNGVKHRANTPEKESETNKPQISEALAQTDQALGSNDVSMRFKDMFGEVRLIPSMAASMMAEEFVELYEQYTQDQLSLQDYAQKIDELFKSYERFNNQQAS